jgi:Rha family phage regulatory protein
MERKILQEGGLTVNQLVFVENGRAVTDSLTVAEVFEKTHDNVIRDIRKQLGKLSEAGEGKWGVLNFEETYYQHPQNKQLYPKFTMTEDGFAIIAMSYTTPEAMKMKVKFLEEFKRMREKLQAPQTVEDLIIMQAQSMKELKEKVALLDQTVSTIQDTFLQRDEDWRKSINTMLNRAAFRMGGQYRDLRNRSYDILEERGRCNLNIRLSNLKERLRDEGATKSRLNQTTKMDVIEVDPRLKEIYTTIVKELSIGSIKAVNERGKNNACTTITGAYTWCQEG